MSSCLLLCKGPGAKLLKSKRLEEYDFIAWANWNNYKDETIKIPTRVDKLYLYDKTYITSIPSGKLREVRQDLKIKSVKLLHYTTLYRQRKHAQSADKTEFYQKKCSDTLCKYWDRDYEYFDPLQLKDRPSTGYAALLDLTLNYNFKRIHVAGMDLFSGKMYYFDAREALASEGGKRKLQMLHNQDPDQICDGVLKYAHPENKAMKNIIQLLKDYPHVEYTFYSINKNYKKQFKKHNVKNGKLITK